VVNEHKLLTFIHKEVLFSVSGQRLLSSITESDEVKRHSRTFRIRNLTAAVMSGVIILVLGCKPGRRENQDNSWKFMDDVRREIFSYCK
jgi:hypothetical protein